MRSWLKPLIVCVYRVARCVDGLWMIIGNANCGGFPSYSRVVAPSSFHTLYGRFVSVFIKFSALYTAPTTRITLREDLIIKVQRTLTER